MKIENKANAWRCGHKSTQRGNVAHMWRNAHKQARLVWKRSVYRQDWDTLIKRI